MVKSFLITCLTFFVLAETKQYKATWDDLDTHTLPEWYDAAKIGLLIHWGPYSVAGYPVPGDKYRGAELFWKRWLDKEAGIEDYVKKYYGENFKYQDLAPMFTAKEFDPDVWAELFQNSGFKYVILTAKHHDGFTLFPSHNSTGWNSVEIGPKMDIVEALSESVRKYNMKFGVYYSFFAWSNPLFLSDQIKQFKHQSYVDEVVRPDILQLIQEYKPSIFWAAGNWYGDDTYWNSKPILSWIYSNGLVKKEIVVNDRWGSNGILCRHGDFYTCGDRYMPKALPKHKWEHVFSLDPMSWGYRKNTHLLSMKKIIEYIVKTVSLGGNALINIGPTHEGIIPDVYKNRLNKLGEWLKINGEALYGTSPWFYQRDSHNQNVWYTCRKETYNRFDPIAVPQDFDYILDVYAIFLEWPDDTNVLEVKDLANIIVPNYYTIEFVKNHKEYEPLKWKVVKGVAHIELPLRNTVKYDYAFTLCIRLYENAE